ncbi:MAG TPA: hypothetical protein VH140_06615 [Candidatus Acidoferrum sp.]|jgi:hypothetical protein|nr:hypothetical protein [Candidatus Acidoferrum sp.]
MAQHLAEHSSPDWPSLQIALSRRPTGGTLKTRQIVDFSSPSPCPQLDYPSPPEQGYYLDFLGEREQDALQALAPDLVLQTARKE